VPTSIVVATVVACVAASPLASAAEGQPASPPAPALRERPSPEDARAFVQRVNADLKRLWTRSQTAEWIQATYITDDTERNAAAMHEDVMAYLSEAIRESLRYRGVAVDPETARMLHLLRLASPLPAPSDPARRAELAALASRLEALYGKGKFCGPIRGVPPPKGKDAGGCRDLQDLEDVLATNRSWDAQLDAWKGWHAIAREMRPMYARFVELANEGAREIGFRDVGELWRSGFDMPPGEFEADVDRLWGEVKPLYDALHCHVRARLQERYGKDRVPDGRPIPAHLLGNMWAQDWSNLYPLVAPYPQPGGIEVDEALKRQRWDARRMVRTGEAFFTSLGLPPLPATFWERSMLTKPRDRDVVCHASAWDVTFSDDLRIKMCVRPKEEDLVTIHHELGHDYYFQAYWKLPVLFQQGANEGFHEAIGDTIALSMTPGYLRSLGLVREVRADERGVLDAQMKRALEKVAFLPFGKLIDQWRWDVFAGKVTPDRYDASWWALRERVQGVAAPEPRTEADFDPGAKYHVPANVPYVRYFLAAVYQFQFYEALCRAAGWTGPLHECSFHGSKEAGRKLEATLAMGASRPWPDAYEALTGKRRADASAMLEYFAPLRRWLQAQNAKRSCGW
jgi:peptidyl-dipeptidase A